MNLNTNDNNTNNNTNNNNIDEGQNNPQEGQNIGNEGQENKPQEIIFTEEQKEFIRKLIDEKKNPHGEQKENNNINNNDNNTNDNNNNVDEGKEKEEEGEENPLLKELEELKKELTTTKTENKQLKKDSRINDVLNKYNFTSNYIKEAVKKDLSNIESENSEDLEKYVKDLQKKEPKLFYTHNFSSKMNQGEKHFDKSFKKMSFNEMTELYRNNPDKFYEMKNNQR